MAGDEFESAPGEGPNPFESPRPWREKFVGQCRDDLAELRSLVDAGRRQEAAELLQHLPLFHFDRPNHRGELGAICAELGYTALAGRWWKDRVLEVGCFLIFVAMVVVFFVGVAAITMMFSGDGPW